MNYLWVFLLGFAFSFLGSIPPGTLNVTILQLALHHQTKIAFRFAIAVAIIEYPYAWIAVQFEDLISGSRVVDNFQLVTAIVMTVLGILSLLPSKRPTGFAKKFQESGFRRGILLSVLNPMAIPYWMIFTAYLKAQGFIDLSTVGLVHCYVFGAAVGTFALLSVVISFAQKLATPVQKKRWINIVAGITLLGLASYAWLKYFSN